MARKRLQIGLGLVFLAAIATNPGGCGGTGGGCNGPELECVFDVDCEIAGIWNQERCEESEGYWECRGGICVSWCYDLECTQASDCEVQGWPGDAGCAEPDGRWECNADQCKAVCDPVACAQASDCETLPWPASAGCVEANGHWECNGDQCEPVCDVVGCGDGTCDAEGGETPANCSQDCDQPCVAPVDCLALEWDAGCEGRWDCVEQACVEVCDYDSCGDEVCSAAEGENAQTCPTDCLEGCTLPTDCYLEQWGQICQGRWNCFEGACMEICPPGDLNCGNGVCWGLNGENEDSCFVDCLGGPCETLVDCFAHRWYEDFGGHWQCNPAMPPGELTTGACEAVRDDVGCGDGTCDVLGAETPVACVADCSDYSCTQSTDCNTLSLPSGCTSWICSSLVCVPQCE